MGLETNTENSQENLYWDEGRHQNESNSNKYYSDKNSLDLLFQPVFLKLESYINSLLELEAKDWGFPYVCESAVEGLKGCLSVLPNVIAHNSNYRNDPVVLNDFFQEIILKMIEAVSLKLNRQDHSLYWTPHRWYSYILKIMLASCNQWVDLTFAPYYLTYQVRTAYHRLTRIHKILTRVLEEDAKYTDVFEAVVIERCKIDGCGKSSCSLFKECPLPIFGLTQYDKETIARLIGSLINLTQSYRKTSSERVYKTFVKNVFYIFRSLELGFDDNLTMPSFHHADDNKFCLAEFFEGLSEIDPNLQKAYLLDWDYQDIDIITKTSKLVIPQRRVASELSSLMKGSSFSEIMKLLIKGDKLLNEYRKDGGLPPIQRVASFNSNEQEALKGV